MVSRESKLARDVIKLMRNDTVYVAGPFVPKDFYSFLPNWEKGERLRDGLCLPLAF